MIKSYGFDDDGCNGFSRKKSEWQKKKTWVISRVEFRKKWNFGFGRKKENYSLAVNNATKSTTIGRRRRKIFSRILFLEPLDIWRTYKATECPISEPQHRLYWVESSQFLEHAVKNFSLEQRARITIFGKAQKCAHSSANKQSGGRTKRAFFPQKVIPPCAIRNPPPFSKNNSTFCQAHQSQTRRHIFRQGEKHPLLQMKIPNFLCAGSKELILRFWVF